MNQRIASYRPAGAPAGWHRVGDEVRRVVTLAEPDLPYRARELLSALSRLALFCDGEGIPASADVWLSREVIERFIQIGCPHMSGPSQGNYRSRLLRLREAVLGPECRTGPPRRLSGSKAQQPYTRTELADLWGWASGQPTDELRRGCKTLLALGAGCGVDSPEVIPLLAHDVRAASHRGGVVLATRGPRRREILCRRPWETVLSTAAEHAATPGTASYLFRPHCHSRGKNTVSAFLARTRRSQGVPRLAMGRLRSTWLVSLFEARVPITVIVAAAGVDTLHGLSRVLPYLSPVPVDEAAECLRGER